MSSFVIEQLFTATVLSGEWIKHHRRRWCASKLNGFLVERNRITSLAWKLLSLRIFSACLRFPACSCWRSSVSGVVSWGSGTSTERLCHQKGKRDTQNDQMGWKKQSWGYAGVSSNLRIRRRVKKIRDPWILSIRKSVWGMGNQFRAVSLSRAMWPTQNRSSPPFLRSRRRL